jgi:hypothetical protein
MNPMMAIGAIASMFGVGSSVITQLLNNRPSYNSSVAPPASNLKSS